VPPTRILLLEDDPAIADTVRFTLEREGYVLEPLSWLHEARQRLAQDLPDLVLLDIGLPDGNSLDLCRELRQRSPVPIMILSARSEEMDRVLGLELGADDYLSKPFSPRELLARVRALLRRAQVKPLSPPEAAGPLFEVDAEGQRIGFDGRWLTLTRLELGLLQHLLRAPSRIQSRESLLDAVWGLEAPSADRTVDTHIKTLRAKLRELRPDLDPIRTHRGLGYSIELPERG
jgi:two-component system catabolic regulation response regulator CreB